MATFPAQEIGATELNIKYLHGTRWFTPARFALCEGEDPSAGFAMSILVFRAGPLGSIALTGAG
jgi:hypothetical protein